MAHDGGVADWRRRDPHHERRRASPGGVFDGANLPGVYAQKLVIEVDERARDTAKSHAAYAHQRYAGGVGNSIDEVRAAQEAASDDALVQQAYALLASDEEALPLGGYSLELLLTVPSTTVASGTVSIASAQPCATRRAWPTTPV